MTASRRFAGVAALLWLMAATVPSNGQEFKWEEVAAADWSAKEDTLNGVRHAVMLFEKITRDDSGWMEDRCFVAIYRRIKIFNENGRSWGDFSIPYLNKQQKVEEIRGRTLHPDGREVALAQSSIIEKEILKAKGFRIKQKSFSLPGISAGCIIEYYVKISLPQPYGIWLTQKSIFLKHGELVWKFRLFRVPPSAGDFFRKYLTPNFIWHPQNFRITPIFRPNYLDAEDVQFTVRDLPAFVNEPYSAPDLMLQPQVRCYYGPEGGYAEYWKEASRNSAEGIAEFCRKRGRLREVFASFSGLAGEPEKIAAAYQWVQKNLKNTTYEEASEQQLKNNKNVEDVLKRGAGTQDDLNMVFLAMLQELKIPAKAAYVVDRDEGFFIPKAKYWQFDRSLVAIEHGPQQYRFYSPGDLHLPLEQIPWFNEGAQALIAGDTVKVFGETPYSLPQANIVSRIFALELLPEAQLSGRVTATFSGHYARRLRLLSTQTPLAEKEDKLKEFLQEALVKTELDSVRASDLEAADRASLSAQIESANIDPPVGSRLFLKPFGYMQSSANPFSTYKRQYPVMFDFANIDKDSLALVLPTGWRVEALPADTLFQNKSGSCTVVFTQQGNMLHVARTFQLNHPYWRTEDYHHIRKLFEARQAFAALTIVLRKE